MRIPLITLTVILAAVFLSVGLSKLLGQQRTREQMDHIGVSVGLTKILGVLDLAGVVGLIVGLFWPPAGIAAAVGIVLEMIGAVIYHLRARDPLPVSLMPLLFAVAAGAVAVLHVLAG
ncbi:DoxX family protein [Micromonospora okii]|uniref:Membrane protein n=1 Tax=Micromonospora okii TaxID=1182970 RepID=A0A023GUJ3_9ACTN|nr:DoxX family protein [Micromonospora okii]AFJ52705.1 membrane protein [Micromonospora okii]AZO92771.1 Orf(+5) [Micromonospora okii]